MSFLKRISYPVSLALFPLFSFSQQHFEGINWGFKVCFTSNAINSDVGPWTDTFALWRTGNPDSFKEVGNPSIQFGGYIAYDINDYFSLQGDLQYTSKGGDYKRTSNQVYTVYEKGGSSSETEYV